MNIHNITINSNFKNKSFVIQHNNQLNHPSNKIFKNSNLKIESNIDGFNISKINNYSKLFQNKINEKNYISNIDNNFNNKNRLYVIPNIKDEYMANYKKRKYEQFESIEIMPPNDRVTKIIEEIENKYPPFYARKTTRYPCGYAMFVLDCFACKASLLS